MLCKHWFSLILGSWEVNLFCSFILFWGVDEVWQREGPAQGQNGVIDQPCQEGVLLVFQLHRGKRGGKRWRAVIQPVWKEKVVSGDWPLQDFERKDRKAEFYADGEGKEIQKCEVLQKGRYGQISREVKSCYNSWSGSCLLPILIFSYPYCRSSIPTVFSLYIYICACVSQKPVLFTDSAVPL